MFLPAACPLFLRTKLLPIWSLPEDGEVGEVQAVLCQHHVATTGDERGGDYWSWGSLLPAKKVSRIMNSLYIYFMFLSLTTYISTCHQYLGNWMLSFLTTAGLIGNSIAVVGEIISFHLAQRLLNIFLSLEKYGKKTISFTPRKLSQLLDNSCSSWHIPDPTFPSWQHHYQPPWSAKGWLVLHCGPLPDSSREADLHHHGCFVGGSPCCREVHCCYISAQDSSQIVLLCPFPHHLFCNHQLGKVSKISLYGKLLRSFS